MSIKILLIQPDYPKDYNFGPKNAILFPPLGLECIAANILDLAEVKIFDYRIFNKTELIKEFERFQPDYVGISCNFSIQIYHVNSIAKLAKDFNAKTIIGGHHPTLVPEETLKSPWIDIVVRSEGEQVFRELIQKNSPIGIRGVSYKNDHKIIHNPDQELCDFNKINPPARNLRSEKIRKRYHFFGLPADLMESSRGCPFKCKFCTVHHFYKKKYRIKSPSNIIKELREISKYSRYVYFIDDNFMVYPKHILNVCNAIIKDHLNMFFMTTARIDMVNRHPEIFEKMAKAGFIFLFLGIENYSNRTLKSLNKQFRFQEIKKGIKILHDLGFLLQGNVILGANYNDTIEDIESTIEITKSLELDLPTFSLLVPYPLTEIRKEVEQKNLLLDRNWKDYNWFTPLIKYENISSEQLQDLLKKAYSENRFFSNPIKTIKKLLIPRGPKFLLERVVNYRFLKTAIPSIKKIIQRNI